MGSFNVYEDARRAESYSRLEFPGTYYLAYRDLPDLTSKYVQGTNALDFGCGAGRSTRFLSRLGFKTIGVDISPEMIRMARSIDPEGDYRLIEEGDLDEFKKGSKDLILSAFTFDNIPTTERKLKCLKGLRNLLDTDGKFINLVSTPDIYKHEWASFSTQDFPENLEAKTGERVRIVMKDVDDRRPVEDVIWYEEDYRMLYATAGMRVVELHKPLANEHEPFDWINETMIPPWAIYVLEPL
jgi:SAM-dependent methyltransferase